MRFRSIIPCFVLVLILGGCGRKDEKPQESTEPESSQGALLEAAEETVNKANERTKKVEKDAESVGE